MKKLAYVLVVVLVLLLQTGCGSDQAAPTLAPTDPPASTPTPMPSATLTKEAEPTTTLLPTATPTPPATATLVPTAAPPTATEAPPDPATEIDADLTSLTQKNAFTGSVLVARDGEVLLSKGYGLAYRAANLPNTPQTKFRICSVTKQFTAMAILILQAQGLLDVQDPVCDYLSECPAAWREIALHHLLTHTSGIPDLTEFPDYEGTKASPATPLQLIARFRDKPLAFRPGETWSYSNSGYILLGYVIEQVSGQSYEAFLQEHIFARLRMGDSGYDHNLGVIAVGYTGEGARWRKGDYIDMSVPYAAGALYSTVEDLYRWDQALYTEQLVPQALLDRMFTPFATSSLGGFGYGWIITREQGRQVVRHGGGGDGFTSIIVRYPADRATVIVLSNRDTTDLRSIVSTIAQKLFAQ